MTKTQERIQTAAAVLDTIAGTNLVGSERHALVVLGAARVAGESVKMSELARRTGLSRAAITTLVDRLTTADLAMRVPCSVDRRRTHVEITSDGYDVVVAMTQSVPVTELEA